jgi:tetratricopeptide (TPR) repeat protein
LIFGRDKDLQDLMKDLSEEKTIKLLVGESGVGKSKLLDEFYQKVKGELSDTHFVGYYDNKMALITESLSNAYPVSICLGVLIQNILETQTAHEELSGLVNRLGKSLKAFFKDEGAELFLAILDDVSKKVGLEKTSNVAKRFYDSFKDIKTGHRLAVDLISKQNDEVFGAYLNVFKILSNEFPDRHFVLIFDQLEFVGKASLDFIVNLAKLLPKRFHIIISFKTEERRWEDQSIRRLYQEIYDKIIYDLNGSSQRVNGLLPEDIGEWIFNVRKIRLKLDPDLVRIHARTAGLPIILESWINESTNLSYEELNLDKYCEQLIRLQNGLSEEDKIRIRRVSILIVSPSEELLATYLQINKENLDLFIDRMVTRGIFNPSKRWFRHELIKRCFEDYAISEERRLDYRNQLLINLAALKKNDNQNVYEQRDYDIDREYAHQLHYARKHKESFYQNYRLAQVARQIGHLNLAENSCNLALTDASGVTEISSKDLAACNNLLGDVYLIWGRFDEALENYYTCLRHYSNANDKHGTAKTIMEIGIVYDHKGDDDEALKKYWESLEMSRAIDDKDVLSDVLMNIGVIQDKHGLYDEALKKYWESLDISRGRDDEFGVAGTLLNIAVVEGEKRNIDQALAYFEESLAVFRRSSSIRNIGMILGNLGNIYDMKGNGQYALKNYQEALKIFQRLGDERNEGTTTMQLGDLLKKQGNAIYALSNYQEALKIFQRLGDEYQIDFAKRRIKELKQ